MSKPLRRTVAANTFGTLGYLSVLFQWVWSLLLLAYPLLKEDSDNFLQPQQPLAPLPPVEVSPAIEPALGLVAVLVTIAILVMTVITLVRLPKMVGKKAAAASRSTAQAVLPVVTRHKKITKKERLHLSYRIILGLKFLAIAIPLVLLCFTPAISELNTPAVWIVGIFTATCSFIYFGVQQLIGAAGKIPPADLW